MNEHMEKIQLQKRVLIDEDNLRWTPLVQVGNPGNIMKDHESSNSEDEGHGGKTQNEEKEAQHSEEEETIKTRKKKRKGKKAALKIDSEESAEENEPINDVSCVLYIPCMGHSKKETGFERCFYVVLYISCLSV